MPSQKTYLVPSSPCSPSQRTYPAPVLPHIASQTTYPVPPFHSTWPAKERIKIHLSSHMASRRTPLLYFPLFALSRSQHHGPSSSRCRRPSTSPSCSVPGLSYYRMSPLFCPTSVTRLLLPAYRRFARRGTREAKPGSVYPSRTVFCLSQLTSIFWLVIPSSKYKQKHTLNRLNHQSLTINTRSSGQVRQFLVRFLPLEKEQGHQTQL